jgi:hypothetical protein
MSEHIGGYRVGAGRKSSWTRPTKMMRLPAEFEAELTAIAHKLDQSEASQPVYTLQEINDAIVAVLLKIRPLDRKLASPYYKRLIKKLAG